MHNLTKAGGPMLESVINELAVMPLPLPPSEADANRNTGESQEQSAQLRKPTQEERRYASELIVRLLDTGIMRKIGAAQRRMAQLPDGAEKIELLGQITELETLRKDSAVACFRQQRCVTRPYGESKANGRWFLDKILAHAGLICEDLRALFSVSPVCKSMRQ